MASTVIDHKVLIAIALEDKVLIDKSLEEKAAIDTVLMIEKALAIDKVLVVIDIVLVKDLVHRIHIVKIDIKIIKRTINLEIKDVEIVVFQKINLIITMKKTQLVTNVVR